MMEKQDIKIDLVNMEVLSNETFSSKDKLRFGITFETIGVTDYIQCIIVYIGDVRAEGNDQVLSKFEIGPFSDEENQYFEIEADLIDLTKIPIDCLFGTTSILLSFTYKNQNFLRVAYLTDIRHSGVDQSLLLDEVEDEDDEDESMDVDSDESMDVDSDNGEEAMDVDSDDNVEAMDVSEDDNEEAMDVSKNDDEEAMDVSENDDEEAMDVSENDDEEAMDVSEDDDEEAMDVSEDDNEEDMDVSEDDDEEDMDVDQEDHPKYPPMSGKAQQALVDLLSGKKRKPTLLKTPITECCDEFNYKNLNLNVSKITFNLNKDPIIHKFPVTDYEDQ